MTVVGWSATFEDWDDEASSVNLLPELDAAERVFAAFCFPRLNGWLPFAHRMSFSLHTLVQAAARSEKNGSDIASELIASGTISETELYRAMAAEAGLGFLPVVDHTRLLIGEEHMPLFLERCAWHAPIKVQSRDGEVCPLIAPEGLDPARLRALVENNPGIARRLLVTSPHALRSAVHHRAQAMLMRSAVTGLFDRNPEFSARLVVNGWQGGVCGALLVVLVVAFFLEPVGTFMASHYLSTCFFLGCVGLRVAAVSFTSARQLSRPTAQVEPRDMPVFSVMVALYKEAAVVPDLLAALDKIEWPRAKLQILMVCERDDFETIATIRAARPGPNVEIVEVPPGKPRTKPKALSYALRMAKGEFVVLYDAEDEPHPGQLTEAWQRFQAAGPDLACLQAPLEISNPGDGFVARMFAFEYRALFGGLLPWLAGRRYLLPLGGTSNHFRREALEKVGGWDPYNVTEDADLGLRLARFGYRTEMLTLPTRETAPLTIGVWLPQRTRWLKGWLQTWFVHMRQPLRLARELGPGSFITAQILLAGMIVSAIVHPLLVLTALGIISYLALGGVLMTSQATLLTIDAANVIGGYASFLLLGRQALGKAERRGMWKTVLLTPVYWLMISCAAWNAVLQLWLRPHHWDKTPHLSRTATTSRAAAE